MVIILVFCVFTTRATSWQHQFVPTAFNVKVISTRLSRQKQNDSQNRLNFTAVSSHLKCGDRC